MLDKMCKRPRGNPVAAFCVCLGRRGNENGQHGQNI